MKVLLTCGIGDFIAIESFLSAQEIDKVTQVYFATRAREALLPLIKIAFPNVNILKCITIKDDFADSFKENFCVESANDIPDLPDDVVDWSFKVIFEQVKLGIRKYEGSCFVKRKLTDVSNFKLPQRYFVVHPYSQNARTDDRDITPEEWKIICRTLVDSGYKIVILNQGKEFLPILPQYKNHIEDLTNFPNLEECFEIIKQSSGFIGASSVLSVIASKLLPKHKIFIKGHDLLKNTYASFYYAPIEEPKIYKNFLRFNLPKRKTGEITVNTVQGIGDIFWVYQKLAPFFDKIHLNILCVSFDSIQQRAKSFSKMLPGVGNVNFHKVSGKTYDKLASTTYRLDDVMLQYYKFIDGEDQQVTDDELSSLCIGSDTCVINYACNNPLERGIRIEKIDRGYTIRKTVNLIGIDDEAQKDNYLCLFVAGQKNDKIWTPVQWLYATKQLLKKLNLNKVILIGAEWDRKIQEEIYRDLKSSNYIVESYVGQLELIDSINIIRSSKFFFGFQSGLNILADNYDVPQLMLYYEHLRPMMNTWCKLENLDTIYNAATFNENIDDVLNRLELK